MMIERTGTNLILNQSIKQSALVAELFESYHQRIYRYLYYRVGNQAAAEDLTSEVFLRAMAAMSPDRLRSYSIQAWLFQIARNLSIDYFRKTSIRQDQQLEEDMRSLHDAPDIEVEKELTGEKLREALARLPEAQRDVIILRFVTQLPIGEVAKTLHKSEDAIKSLQRRALVALRDRLVEWEISYV